MTTQSRKLKNGDYKLSLDFSLKSRKQLKEAALADKELSLEDVKNQIINGKETFTELLVSAYIVKLLKYYAEAFKI